MEDINMRTYSYERDVVTGDKEQDTVQDCTFTDYGMYSSFFYSGYSHRLKIYKKKYGRQKWDMFLFTLKYYVNGNTLFKFYTVKFISKKFGIIFVQFIIYTPKFITVLFNILISRNHLNIIRINKIVNYMSTYTMSK